LILACIAWIIPYLPPNNLEWEDTLPGLARYLVIQIEVEVLKWPRDPRGSGPLREHLG